MRTSILMSALFLPLLGGPLFGQFVFDETIDIGPAGQQVQTGAIAFPSAGAPGSGANGTDFTGPLVIGGNAVTLTIDDTDQAGNDVA